jgi:LysR family transcriptional regulator, glycine cleavage system transcriptional activator
MAGNARDLRLPSLDGLRAVDAAARLSSFERAADVLAITASAVAKRVAAVEELLGTPLFLRNGRALQPTPACLDYLPPVRAALALLAQMPQHQRPHARSRRLRISAPPTFARLVLVPALEDFTRLHPDIDIEVVLSIPFLDNPDHSAAQADVAVRHGDPAQLGGTVLMHDLVLPVAAPSLLQRLGRLNTPADLARAPLLRTPVEPWAPWFRAAGLPWPEPTQGPRLVDLGLTLEAALGGQGVALARPALARRWLADGSLLPLFALTAQPAMQYLCLPLAAGANNPAAMAFAHWLTLVSRAAMDEGVAALRR